MSPESKMLIQMISRTSQPTVICELIYALPACGLRAADPGRIGALALLARIQDAGAPAALPSLVLAACGAAAGMSSTVAWSWRKSNTLPTRICS